MDPKVNGQIQTEWRWLIALYLFLGGVGAGAYTIAAINSFLGKTLEPSTVVGLWISWPALIIGSLCLLADLGSPAKAIDVMRLRASSSHFGDVDRAGSRPVATIMAQSASSPLPLPRTLASIRNKGVGP